VPEPHQNGRGTSDVWLTPPELLGALGPFDLDPCTPEVQPWPTAARRYTEADDGLLQPWEGRVWLNPPYSRPGYSLFMARMARHGWGTALIFARTETRDFFEHVWRRAHALLFIEGRLFFHDVHGRRARANAGAPSVLCAYGMADAEILSACSIAGQFVPLRVPRTYAVLALSSTWREAVLDWMRSNDGPVEVDAIYRAFASHPKARANRHWRAKLRQTLQRGPFQRVRRGVWAAVEAA
jgi:hypothetical protein